MTNFLKVVFLTSMLLYPSGISIGSPKTEGAATDRKNMLYKKHATGRFTVGKKYKIKGKVYKPKVDLHYMEEGVASWYGPGFHGKLTANGTIYNTYEYTAAHPTLHLPSVVKVTNLENGTSVDVVVNDRGPFRKRRVIDVSQKVAEDLGFYKAGTAKVRVEYLHDKTLELLAQYPEKEQNKARQAFEIALLQDSKNLIESKSY